MLRNATNLLSMNILSSDRDIWKSSTSNVEAKEQCSRKGFVAVFTVRGASLALCIHVTRRGSREEGVSSARVAVNVVGNDQRQLLNSPEQDLPSSTMFIGCAGVNSRKGKA